MDNKGRHQSLAISNNCIAYILKNGATSEDMQSLFDKANEKAADVKIPVTVKGIPLILIKKEETQNIYVLLKSETVLMSREELRESIEQNEQATQRRTQALNKKIQTMREIRQRPRNYTSENEKGQDLENVVMRCQNENKHIYRRNPHKKPALH